MIQKKQQLFLWWTVNYALVKYQRQVLVYDKYTQSYNKQNLILENEQMAFQVSFGVLVQETVFF